MMSHWWVADAWNESPVVLLAHIFWVIFAITLHELAHGWTAIRCGDRTPIESGHMTWNPVVHMGSTSLIMFALWGIAWGAMPINPANFRSRLDHAKVALAGPSMNLALYVLAIAICIGIGLVGKSLDHQTYHNLFMFFFVGAYLNMALMLFNLLPVPPLDGWRVATELWPGYGAVWRRGNAPTLAIVIFAVIFIFGGPMIFQTAGEFTVGTIKIVASVLGRGAPRP